MGDLIGFENFLNTTTPFISKEHKAIYKTHSTYADFKIGNNYNASCEYPRFWNSSGQRVLKGSDAVFSQLTGCYDSEFDQVIFLTLSGHPITLTCVSQYGDTEAFGNFPDWQRQLSKFASTQDRLREWIPSVRSKIELFTCLTISMLDIDGFRLDKATQVTVDALAEFGASVRSCARNLGKENFFVTGEITGGDTFGSIYLGRGREPEQRPKNITEALLLTNTSPDVFLRDSGKNALDSAAFHYSVYRHLTRLLGMDGNITIPYDTPDNILDTWNTFLTTNDLVNPNTDQFDPRHMLGVTNQDVFRWPAIKDGTHKMLLGLFITTLELPGIPLLLWGEEQASYVLDSTASNYLFGRSPMSSAIAWQNHGCYKLGSTQYYNFPVDSAANGCHDDQVSLDHRDPSHPVHNIIKSMYSLRREYPVLNDGYFLQQLSNNTHLTFLPGSNGTATEIGVWSVVRDQYPGVQNLTGTTPAQPVWLVYQNDGQTVNYKFDCGSNDTALIAPFPENTTVKNLLAPYDEVTLKSSPKKLFLDESQYFNGCLDELSLDAWAFKAYVPKENWVSPAPIITKFLPGHDARILASPDGNSTVDIVFQFSHEMDCDSIQSNLIIASTTDGNSLASIDPESIVCSQVNDPDVDTYVAQIQSTWAWSARVVNVQSGVHVLTIQNVSVADGSAFTDSIDHFMFRIGNADNPIVFPRTANYSSEVLTKKAAGSLEVSHKAAGANKWRYSTNWGSLWSPWMDYAGGNSTIAKQPWSGTKRQEWSGEHVILQYWSRATGSSSHIQHGDAEKQASPRRFPHLFAHGPFNQFGYDGGLNSAFQLQSGLWKFHLMTEWPAQVQLNVWGINPDGNPDQSFVYGDVDNDTIIDRSTPGLLGENMINITQLPPSPYLAYRVELGDATMKFNLVPAGSRIVQLIIFALLWSIPVFTGVVSIWTYMGAFYKVKFNASGIVEKTKSVLPFNFGRKFEKLNSHDENIMLHPTQLSETRVLPAMAVPTIALNGTRRTVLIATMEYVSTMSAHQHIANLVKDIEDWEIKIKIGGLGVMAQLMGKSLTDHDLIWVVPCVGGIDYPIDQPAEPMTVTILGALYTIKVQYHKLKNITYVLLDAPIFRQQTKSEPYPPRMDDLDSAVYYSAWNACIAQAYTRFPVDIYHINDYHGAAAPLYLLPKTIPCCLSLHNAEFQGLWPMRSPQEQEEVYKVFNLEKSIVKRYIQFGEVFNLLHAGARFVLIFSVAY
jgi:alpha-1,3-glucan synthase